MSKRTKYEPWRPPANPELAKAMAELGRSSAAQPQDTRPHRQRSRADAKRAAIKDQDTKNNG